jgi:hypothetical protein
LRGRTGVGALASFAVFDQAQNIIGLDAMIVADTVDSFLLL